MGLLRRALVPLFSAAVGALLSCCAFMFWVSACPNADDPKNIDYVLWKHGLNNNMNLDAALRAMTHDSWPILRVAGLSKEQLQNRFGYIRAASENPGAGSCYPDVLNMSLRAHPSANEVVSLRNSLWMVALEDGKAVNIVLCKGG